MSNAPSASPILFLPELSVFQRLSYSIRLHVTKFLANSYFTFLNLPGVKDKKILPTYSKTYECRPQQKNRVYFPKSWKSGDPLLPLYINIHGGGFALMSPLGDDRFCSYFSDTNKVLVVSLDYPKAPQHKFPALGEALVDLVHSVLQDEALPIDKSKVAIGGFSAGANLSLVVSQHESLQGKIHGVVAYYPPVDFSTPVSEAMKTRPKDAGPDMLESDGPMFNFGYIKRGQDLTDPLLSVTYAPREKLPPKVYLIGCEFDLLCRGAEIMALRLAGIKGESAGDSWEENGIKWEKIKGEIHGFDVYPAFGEVKVRREKRRLKMHESVAEWLFREVYH